MHKDQQYLKALKEQDPTLCQQIYQKFLPKVIVMIKTKGGNEQQAKEVFQEALMAIILVLKTKDIKLTASFGAYLKGICYHKFINLCRAQKNNLRNVENLRLNSEGLLDSPDIEHLLKKEKQFDLFWACFEKLKGDCKKMIKGKLDGLRAVAVMQQINYTETVNAFYVKQFECMRRLKLCIQQNGDDALMNI